MCRVGRPINVWFAKGKPQDINRVALHVTLTSRALEFVEFSTLWDILEDIFFEIHIADARCKQVSLWYAMGKLSSMSREQRAENFDFVG